MKNIILLLILTISFSNLISQTEFAPSGAKWTYGFWDSYQGNLWDGYETIEYNRDTSINGISMKILERFSYVKVDSTTVDSNFNGSYIIYQEGEKVFDHLGNLFYDFGAEEGDTVLIASHFEAVEIIILQKNIIMINGNEAIEFIAKPNCEGFSSNTLTFNSRIASVDYFFMLFNYCVLDITPTYHLRCYEDDTIGFHQISDEDCDEIQIIVANGDIPDAGITLTISPNPTFNNQFYLKTEHVPSNTEVHIYSSLGQLLFKEKWTENGQAFTLPQSGVFYIAVFSKGKRVAMRKLVGM